MKIAYLNIPHCGGTYTVYRLLKQGLEPRGYELHCVSSGLQAAQRVGSSTVSAREHIVCPSSQDARERTAALVDFMKEQGFDLVVANPGGDDVGTNAIRFLSVSVRRICIVHTITYGAYAPTAAVSPWADMVVAVNDRIATDITTRWRFARACVRTIYHGVPLDGASPRDLRSTKESLRLLSLGRICDYDKGVMWLPRIMARVVAESPGTRLTVVGDGPDRRRLEESFAKSAITDSVRFEGRVPLEHVPTCFSLHHVFLMPSRFEGCPTALLEGMAVGCVPVVSLINGGTQRIVQQGESGFLCPVGATKAFADAVLRLDRDRDLLRRMSEAARRRIEQHFSLKRMADDYDRLFQEVVSRPYRGAAPLSLEKFDMHPLFQPTWRTRIPMPIKNFARKWLERMGMEI